MKKKTIYLVIGLIILLLVSFIFPAYTLRSYHSDTTISSESWTEWPFGYKTNYKYHESPLEAFLKQHLGESIDYQWVSSSGTSKNIYGVTLGRGHGMPNRLLAFSDERVEKWMGNNSTDEILEFYNTLQSGNDVEIELAITHFFDPSY